MELETNIRESNDYCTSWRCTHFQLLVTIVTARKLETGHLIYRSRLLDACRPAFQVEHLSHLLLQNIISLSLSANVLSPQSSLKPINDGETISPFASLRFVSIETTNFSDQVFLFFSRALSQRRYFIDPQNARNKIGRNKIVYTFGLDLELSVKETFRGSFVNPS